MIDDWVMTEIQFCYILKNWVGKEIGKLIWLSYHWWKYLKDIDDYFNIFEINILLFSVHSCFFFLTTNKKQQTQIGRSQFLSILSFTKSLGTRWRNLHRSHNSGQHKVSPSNWNFRSKSDFISLLLKSEKRFHSTRILWCSFEMCGRNPTSIPSFSWRTTLQLA